MVALRFPRHGAAAAALCTLFLVPPVPVGAAPVSAVLASEQGRGLVPAPGLERLLAAAQAQNPQLLAARGSAEALAEDYAASRQARLPSIGLSSTTTLGEPSTSLTVTQPLFTSGRISAEISVAEQRAALGETEVAATGQELSLALVDAWAETARQYALAGIHRETLDALAGYQAMMERRVAQAVSSESELALVTSRVLATEAELARAQRMVQIGRQQLSALARRPVSVPADLAFDAGTLGSADTDSLLASEAAVEAAVEASPAVDRARQAVAVAEAETRSARAGRGIEVLARLEQRLTGPDELGDETVGYLALQFAPGPGLSAFSRVRSARAQEGAARYRLDNARDEVRTSLLQARDRVRLELERADKLAANAEALEGLLASYERQFAAGTKSWLEVLNTLREVAGSRQGEVIARLDAVAAWYRLRSWLAADGAAL
jgi:adhesin transport system outer membrane protein